MTTVAGGVGDGSNELGPLHLALVECHREKMTTTVVVRQKYLNASGRYLYLFEFENAESDPQIPGHSK